ncbi:MAG: 50S ribosomal protein L5 [Chloroflexota bacterium]|nr:MAG: 50S ribosomal protein L5 [Chloroflexota bacterium]TMD86953.1 MAG: 50S ribosomal protein L5 [Chloroflexota bacterium]
MNVAAKSKAVKAAPSPKGPSVVASPAGAELRLKQRYQDKIVPTLIQRFAYTNALQVPRLVKVVANIGIGESISNPKALDAATADLKKITGQQPVVMKSRKAIANFKLRAGLPIGIKVTLRGARMYQFVDKLISVGLPRIRDFRGISPSGFDGHGNYTLGLREQLIFPEIEYDKIDKLRGLEVTFVTTARTDEEARALLTEVGFPFRK